MGVRLQRSAAVDDWRMDLPSVTVTMRHLTAWRPPCSAYNCFTSLVWCLEHMSKRRNKGSYAELTDTQLSDAYEVAVNRIELLNSLARKVRRTGPVMRALLDLSESQRAALRQDTFEALAELRTEFRARGK